MTDTIGALRARITLHSPQRVADEIGGAAIAWSDEGEVWTEIVALGASESAAFDTIPATTSFRVTINTRDDVRAGWRITWGARSLRVTGVRNDGAARIELSCEEEIL